MAAPDFNQPPPREAPGSPAPARSEAKPGRCAECGRQMAAGAPGRLRRRICSRACQQRAYRRAHAAEYNARQRERRAQRREGLDVDTAPLSPAEEAMTAATAEEIARCEWLTHEEVLAQLAALRKRA